MALLPHEVDPFRQRLESDGEETVRQNLALSRYGEEKAAIAVEWLRKSEAAQIVPPGRPGLAHLERLRWRLTVDTEGGPRRRVPGTEGTGISVFCPLTLTS